MVSNRKIRLTFVWTILQTKDVRTLIVPGHVQRIAEGEFLWNCFLNDQFPYTNGSFDISIHFYLQSVKLVHAFYLTLGKSLWLLLR